MEVSSKEHKHTLQPGLSFSGDIELTSNAIQGHGLAAPQRLPALALMQQITNCQQHTWCALPRTRLGLPCRNPVETLGIIPRWLFYGAGLGLGARAAAGASAGAAAANRRASSDTGRAASCAKPTAAPGPAPGLSAAHVGGMQVCTPDMVSK